MRLSSITALLAALTATTSADRMTVNIRCPCNICGSCDSRDATFFTDSGSYKVNANKGCRSTSVPMMTEFCVDWGKGRAHFRYSGQANKRCLLMRSQAPYGCSADHCHRTEWEPATCNW